jgi:hypothetical protein
MYRRKHGEQTESGETTNKPTITTPDWFDGSSDKNITHERSKSAIRQIQHIRGIDNDRNRSSTRGQSRRIDESTSGRNSHETRSTDSRESRDISRNQVGSQVTLDATEFTFTLQQLRDSLDDDTLKQLLTNQYDSTRVVKLKKNRIPSRFAEDELFKQTKIPRVRTRKKRIPTKVTPSAKYANEIENFNAGLNEGSAETVLGIYFKLYLKLFGEEDPEWNGTDHKQALATVRSFANNLTAGNYRMIIVFLRKLMPLWKIRLQTNEKFPTNRPTIEALFGGKKHFWANRKLYYRTWQNKQQ